MEPIFDFLPKLPAAHVGDDELFRPDGFVQDARLAGGSPFARDADVDAAVHEGDEPEFFRIADDALIADVVECDFLIGGVEFDALEPELLDAFELFLIIWRIGVHPAEGKDVRLVGMLVDFRGGTVDLLRLQRVGDDGLHDGERDARLPDGFGKAFHGAVRKGVRVAAPLERADRLFGDRIGKSMRMDVDDIVVLHEFSFVFSLKYITFLRKTT